ncbi:DegT/DnrJ/EryC1/StrS family aminotransferase [Streptomyces sp. NPDC052811]|uniref:DegT/DnrJ/EryC1/StrS family aminotransferase n=1 Tax=Streptomyces sp. NPDC052811 TaxID=3155731 RepID=UPI00342E647D
MRIPLSSVALTGLETAYAHDALASGWISGTGAYLERFEAALAERTGRSHVIAVNSGTSALQLALLALDIGPGDEVIVPALTFVAPAAAVRAVGARPVLCDIHPRTWTLDPDSAARAMTARTKAIVAVDLMGHPADFDALARLGVPVVEDAAQAHGARYRGRPVGAEGIASVFSFHANKAVSTGEGGCVAVDDAGLMERMRLIANHGMSTARPYWHELVGHNFRMTNPTAAIGLGQVERWDELVAARRRVADQYTEKLRDTPLGLRPVAPWATWGCWLYSVTTPRCAELVAALRARGIDARGIWPALTSLPLYREAGPPCPVAEEVSATTAWLPTFADMPAKAVQDVVDAVRDVVETW